MTETSKDWKQLEFEKWLKLSKLCPARVKNLWCNYECSITQNDCYIESCFAKYWKADN